ncbi:MAG: RNase adapter RapZ [Ilumatobacteraceae bacterium]|nr:RNase adapter RapZ [Ilumatobacteraceae bacterium]MBJ7421544.1 RNase adapter RapZ [Ilumatobacteraceae bacterium]
MADILLIAGLSGAGRSQAADDLEDLGWFVVDNMPTELIDKVVEIAAVGESLAKLALVVSTPTAQRDVVDVLKKLRLSGHRVRMLFLDATNAELVKRYGSTRRKHPLAEGKSGVEEAITKERTLLEPVKAEADLVIDTTNLTIHQLKNQLGELFTDDGELDTMQISVVSFGYKHGLPLDVDLVFDVRFLPNPHWDENLRPMSGLDEPVRDFVMEQSLSVKFLDQLTGMLTLLLPAYKSEGKSYLTVAIGCTGGRHRSVVIAEQLKQWLIQSSHNPRVTHRDISR